MNLTPEQCITRALENADVTKQKEKDKRLNKDTIGHIGNMLLSDGYSRISIMKEYQQVDQEIAERSTCPHCENKCRYEGFEKDGSYLAYIVCTECDAAFEF